MAGAAALMEQIEVQFEHVVLVIAELISLPGCQLIQFNHDDTHLDTLLDFRGATAAAVQWRPSIAVVRRPRGWRLLYGSILYSRLVTILHAHLLHYGTDTLAAQRMRSEGAALSSPGNKNTATSAIPG